MNNPHKNSGKVTRRLSRGSLLCPVCRKHKFEEKGKYEICPVCGWEDDPIARKDPSFDGGANGISLEEARKRFDERTEEKE